MEAIALLETYGSSSVRRRLRLSGQDLNKRRAMLGHDQPPAAPVEPPDGFVELVSERLVQAPRQPYGAGCLELIRADGLRLRIEPGDRINAQCVLDRFLKLGG